MASKWHKIDKKESVYAVQANTLIERLRKARALSCNPSDVGMDSYLDWLTRYGRAYFLMGRTQL